MSQTTNPSHFFRQAVDATGLDQHDLAEYLGTSFASLVRWQGGEVEPDADVVRELQNLLEHLKRDSKFSIHRSPKRIFASRGIRRATHDAEAGVRTPLLDHPAAPLMTRLKKDEFWGGGRPLLEEILADHQTAAPTSEIAMAEGVSAGKNTYTYDAHTYHTKVPPQGIAKVIERYLPRGGLVLDPFGGSGMTGVAALTTGHDVILNELSPAASFIANRFTTACNPIQLSTALATLNSELSWLRSKLYTTKCRCCEKDTELLFTVWSYKVECGSCGIGFVLWDESRSYGKTVREHKFLREFPCPSCGVQLKKSRLKRSTTHPVLVGYKCCRRTQTEVEPNESDLELIAEIESGNLIEERYTPDFELPDGVNLSQPKRHGLKNVKQFYTKRNLAAMSHIWKVINRFEDAEIAGFLGFVFTSLYQRVTRLSEYRFWGGSGNTANFNVPYIFNETNVFATFDRKARSILDHLESTAQAYAARSIVRTGSATDLNSIPSSSIDLIFTDPPFGANINYSEMNMLWEAWLKDFTNAREEAIVSRVQNKDIEKYQDLMERSLSECYRVLRPNHWMVLVFMNSAENIWACIREAITRSGFSIERIDIFDKQHGTFKQFVSENTAGADLMIHCRKSNGAADHQSRAVEINPNAVRDFLMERKGAIPVSPFLHVVRKSEIDFRLLYSEFLSTAILEGSQPLGFGEFKRQAAAIWNAHGKENE